MLNWDQRLMKLRELGEVYLYIEKPFDWRILQDNVFLIDGEDELVPQGQAINPYAVVDDHWRQLTHGSPLIRVYGKQPRIVTWQAGNWTDEREARTSS